MGRPRGPVEVIRRAEAEEPKDHASLVGLFSDELELMDDGIEQPWPQEKYD